MHEGVPALSQLGERDRRASLRPRAHADEVWGIGDVLLARATDESLVENGQDGGFVSALLIYALEHDIIDAALVSGLEGDGSTWRAKPTVARTSEDVIETAKSRYTYSANLLAYEEAVEGGAERIGLVGMGCMASAPGAMQARKAGKVARRLCLTIGLLCSKTFDDSIFEELFEAKYGIKRADITKMNIKGVFQLWTKDGGYEEVPLKEAHAYTREGCTHCPDFAAEHADLSTGGIGAFGDWTLVIARTDLGRETLRDERAGAHRDSPGRRRPGRGRPAAQARPRLAKALARERDTRSPTSPRHGGLIAVVTRATHHHPARTSRHDRNDRHGAARSSAGPAPVRTRSRTGRRLAERLKDLRRKPAALYVSPLERTRETAAPIAKATGLRAVVERGLLECDFGTWTGKRLATLSKRPEWRTVQHAPSTFRFPDGESFVEMQQRMWKTVESSQSATAIAPSSWSVTPIRSKPPSPTLKVCRSTSSSARSSRRVRSVRWPSRAPRRSCCASTARAR